MDNTPRAAIHVGTDKKTFSAQVSNEAERRGWDEKRYQLKNAEYEKNNHYNFSRKYLNFEVTKGGKIVPLGSNTIPLHERLQKRYDELGFKSYMDADHPDQISQNSPNSTVGIIFSGDHDVMHKLAFGSQMFDTSDPDVDCSKVKLQKAIYDWAVDTYNFACRKWGEENIIGFCVHCDETNIHAHVQTVPVEQVKKRGRIGSVYINNDNPDIQLSTKEWKALPKEERGNYTKTLATKDKVERVSYAKVWGETRLEKSKYLSQLHTDYHNEVGYKYGLERGKEYDELTDEEKRERKHKDKVTLEAERQAKATIANAVQENLSLSLRNEGLREEKDEIVREAELAQSKKEDAEKALDDMKEYAVLATIDKKELTFPLLDIAKPVKDAKDAVAKELSIPIPAVIGQKKWREDRTTNINIAIEALVSAINAARDKQNKGVTDSVNKTYTYYMQHLNTLIEKNKLLVAENKSLKVENANVKQRISELDENAVGRVTKQKDGIIHRLKEQLADSKQEYAKLDEDYNSLETKHNNLVNRWNALWKEPEFNNARKLVNGRQKREVKEAEERKAADVREAKLVAERKTNILNKFISEGRQAQREFALSHRSGNFDQGELARVYYAIIALATKNGISLNNRIGIKSATTQFLDGCDWSGMTEYRGDCCRSWTNLFTTNEVTFGDSTIEPFLAFIDHISCSQDTYVSLMGGSSGCANQLTDWDGKKKRGLGAVTKKKGCSVSR